MQSEGLSEGISLKVPEACIELAAAVVVKPAECVNLRGAGYNYKNKKWIIKFFPFKGYRKNLAKISG